MGKVSGPLLDRIDIHVSVPSLSFDELTDARPSGPTSAEVRKEVQTARDRQRTRYGARFHCNAHLDSKAIRQYCVMTPGAKKLLESALERMGLSARAYDKILRVARTLADLDGLDMLGENHLGEAIQYRTMDVDNLV